MWCDRGFTGNIALKPLRQAKQLATYLKLVLNRTLMSRIGAVLASGAFAALKDRMDPRKHNGGVFLGLNGVWSRPRRHGCVGFATAIDVAIEMVRNDLVNKIKTDVLSMAKQRRRKRNSMRRSMIMVLVQPAAAGDDQ